MDIILLVLVLLVHDITTVGQGSSHSMAAGIMWDNMTVLRLPTSLIPFDLLSTICNKFNCVYYISLVYTVIYGMLC